MALYITNFAHGTTTDNEKRLSSGWNEPELSELGKTHAQNARDQRDKSIEYAAIFCSDLKRAHDTAHIIFPDRNDIIDDKRLRECNYGDLNGQSSEIVEPMQEQNITTPFPNGESYEDVKARMQDFVNEMKEKYDGKHIAIISHKAPQIALDVIANGKTWEQAHADDWRKTKSWQPGWEYVIE